MKHKTLSLTKEVIELGTFEMVSGVAQISDPCYDRETWCAGKLTNVLNGTWKAQVIKKVETHEYEGKVEAWAKGKTFTDHSNVLIAVHESFDKSKVTIQRAKIHGVMDAGCAGIFDDKFYKKNYTEDYLQVGRLEYEHDRYAFNRESDLPIYESMAKEAKTEEQRKIYEQLCENIKNFQTKPVDYSKAKPTRDWYEICCDKVLSNTSAGVINNGVVSSSGYGDGGYTTYAAYDSEGRVVGIKLRF